MEIAKLFQNNAHILIIFFDFRKGIRHSLQLNSYKLQAILLSKLQIKCILLYVFDLVNRLDGWK